MVAHVLSSWSAIAAADRRRSWCGGRRLVTEVAAAGPGRRAFVDIQPVTTTNDTDAGQQGWTRTDRQTDDPK
jgi:hypothetical protein